MLNSLSMLFAAMALADLMSLAIFGSLRHAAIPGINRWMAANAAAIGGLLLYALRDLIPIFLSVVVGNALFAGAIVLGYQGCRQFFRQPPATLSPYVCLLAMMAGICYWNYLDPDINARIAVLSFALTYLYAIMGWFIWRHRKPVRLSYSYVFMLAVVAAAVSASLARGVAYGIGFAHQQTLLVPTLLNVAFITTSALALPAVSSGMVMLAHDDMIGRLERWANLDELTGAFTRRAFFTRMRSLIAQARSGGVFSVAIVDLDHFKSINDKHGHGVGDLVLAHFGEFAVSSLREANVFGRLGGEEFAILFPGLNRQEAMAMLEFLRTRLRNDFPRSADDALPVFTFSAGVDECRPDESVEDLMLRVDMALYTAKAQGRDRVVSADALPAEG